MNLELKDAGTARKIALITFDVEEIRQKENEACKEIGKIATIPGFRKGKAPAAVIRKKYSKELLIKRKIAKRLSKLTWELMNNAQNY